MKCCAQMFDQPRDAHPPVIIHHDSNQCYVPGLGLGMVHDFREYINGDIHGCFAN